MGIEKYKKYKRTHPLISTNQPDWLFMPLNKRVITPPEGSPLIVLALCILLMVPAFLALVKRERIQKNWYKYLFI